MWPSRKRPKPPSPELGTYFPPRDPTRQSTSPEIQTSQARWPCMQEPCSYEGLDFARLVDLQRHTRVIHNRDTLQLVSCEYSGCHRKGHFGFTRRDKMIDHMRDVHHVKIPRRTANKDDTSGELLANPNPLWRKNKAAGDSIQSSTSLDDRDDEGERFLVLADEEDIEPSPPGDSDLGWRVKSQPPIVNVEAEQNVAALRIANSSVGVLILEVAWGDLNGKAACRIILKFEIRSHRQFGLKAAYFACSVKPVPGAMQSPQTAQTIQAPLRILRFHPGLRDATLADRNQGTEIVKILDVAPEITLPVDLGVKLGSWTRQKTYRPTTGVEFYGDYNSADLATVMWTANTRNAKHMALIQDFDAELLVEHQDNDFCVEFEVEVELDFGGRIRSLGKSRAARGKRIFKVQPAVVKFADRDFHSPALVNPDTLPSPVPAEPLKTSSGGVLLSPSLIDTVTTSSETKDSSWKSSSEGASKIPSLTDATTLSSQITYPIRKDADASLQEERNDATFETSSVRTDGRVVKLPEAWQLSLTREVATHIAIELSKPILKAIFSQEGAAIETECLLQVFAISMKESSGTDEDYLQGATFVRHQRPRIAKQLEVLATAWEPSDAENPSLDEKLELLWRVSEEFEDIENDDDGGPGGKYNARTLYSDAFSMQERLSEPEPRNLAKVREFLLQNSGFAWLAQRVERLSSMQRTGDTCSAIRSRLARVIETLSLDDRLALDLVWDPVEFLKTETQSETLRLSEVVVYCGSLDFPYATTLSDYATWAWPASGNAVIECFEQAAVSESQVARVVIETVTLDVELKPGITRVWITRRVDGREDASASFRDMLEVAEICVWLVVAGRTNLDDATVGVCAPHLSPELETGNNMEKLMTVSSYSLASRISGENVCWTDMVRNPVIAWGYPVPLRPESDVQKGIELSPGMMVGLSQASWATTFDNVFLLKGVITALVPVMLGSTWIVWHLLINRNHDRMTYRQACATASVGSASRLDVASLFGYRHFVGIWTSRAFSLAGTNVGALYDLRPSESRSARNYTCSLTNVMINGGMFLNAGVGIAFGRKDRAPALSWSDGQPYELQIRDISEFEVLFYGSEDRRAWLIDGASALLHLARAWMMSTSARYMSTEALKKLEYPKPPGGKEAALDTLMANMRKNILLFERVEEQQEIVDSVEASRDSEQFPGFASQIPDSNRDQIERKRQNKTTISGWTYQDLIVSLCQLLEAIYDKLYSLDYHPPEFQIKVPTTKPLLGGFEICELITRRGPFRPRVVELNPHAENWVKFITERCAIVLLAETFGDLIRPQVQRETCLRTSAMHLDHDLLAIPLPILEGLAKRWKKNRTGSLRGCVQITDYFWWHSFDAVSDLCSCNPGSGCQVYSRLGEKAMYANQKSASALSSKDVFELYPHGATIIGGGTNKLQRLHVARNSKISSLDAANSLDNAHRERRTRASGYSNTGATSDYSTSTDGQGRSADQPSATTASRRSSEYDTSITSAGSTIPTSQGQDEANNFTLGYSQLRP